MSSAEDIKTAHLELSQSDWDYRELALANPEYRRRTNFPRLTEPPPNLDFASLQLWPTFIRRHKLEELISLSLGVSKLVRGVLDQAFKGDPDAISRYYGLSKPAMTRVLLSQPRGIDEAMARGDFVLTANGFKCIEFNLMANLGGWETSLIADMHLQTPMTARFIAEKKLAVRYTDTLELLFRHILEDARSLFPDDSKPLNIAFGMQPQGGLTPQEAFADFKAVLAEAHRKACEATESSPEGQIFLCYPEQFQLDRAGHLILGEERIHAVVAVYTANPPNVFRSFKSLKIKLYNGPACSLVNDKRVIAMLSMLAETELVNTEERKLIAKTIPWTRTLDVPPALQGVYAALTADELLARQDELVIKAANSLGGEGVFIGRFTSPQDWSAVVDKALGSSQWVIQEYLQSVPLLYQNGENECSPHNAVWGPFVFGQTYGGMILRVQPQADRTPVNLSLTATEGMIFEID